MATSHGIKLDDQIHLRLKALAQKRDRSPHWIMKTAIEDYLDREEAYEKEKSEDMARWERYVATGNAIDSEKVETWLQDLAEGKKTKWQK